MIAVDKIGEIRRAFFERHLPIKEIVRTLSVSRATVRKVIRSKATEFRYERGVQRAPKLGEWVEVLTEILEKEARLPRLEPRDDHAPGSAADHQGRAHEAVAQPNAVRARLFS